MAESDYRRLAASCHCGKPTKVKLGTKGRPPKYCEEHSGPPRPTVKRQIECPGCRGIFFSCKPVQVYCSRTCKARHKRGCKPKDEVRSHTCKQCLCGFESTHPNPMYCCKSCKTQAWITRTGYRPEPRLPVLCAYFAKYCSDCGVAGGGRRDWSRCNDCARHLKLAAGRMAGRLLEEAKHKAAGKVVQCVGCGCEFCPLYGNKTRRSPRCTACHPMLRLQSKRVQKAKRRAWSRGVDAESVDPFVVFRRDGWLCRLCGVDTPESKRGTYDDDAPELDHITPLSRGGSHSYSNTQCLCRSCNQFKGAMTMEEVVVAVRVGAG